MFLEQWNYLLLTLQNWGPRQWLYPWFLSVKDLEYSYKVVSKWRIVQKNKCLVPEWFQNVLDHPPDDLEDRTSAYSVYGESGNPKSSKPFIWSFTPSPVCLLCTLRPSHLRNYLIQVDYWYVCTEGEPLPYVYLRINLSMCLNMRIKQKEKVQSRIALTFQHCSWTGRNIDIATLVWTFILR